MQLKGIGCPRKLASENATGLPASPLHRPPLPRKLAVDVLQPIARPARRWSGAIAHAVAATSPSTLSVSPAPVPELAFANRSGMYDKSGKLLLKNLTLQELEEWCVSVGEAPKRAKQLFRALYGNGHWIRDLDQMDRNTAAAYSAAFKAKVSASASLSGGLELQAVHRARDGTHKLVYRLIEQDGTASGTVETVLIPMFPNKQGGKLRYTACLSTQVGCAMNCQFCYTGRMGLLGNLNTAQIVEQVVQARRWLAEQAELAAAQEEGSAEQAVAAVAARLQQQEAGVSSLQGVNVVDHDRDDGDDDQPVQGALSLLASSQEADAGQQSSAAATQHSSSEASSSSSGHGQQQRPRVMPWQRAQNGRIRPVPLSNIVFMGMGEPLDNYDNVVAAIDILAQGLELSRSKIIVSTVGLADRMARFLESGKAKLALSLHATTDEVRDWIVPTNRRHPISSLTSLLEKHFPPAQKGDKFVVIEYVLLGGVNDTLEDAQRLVELTANIYCMINLIVFNPWEGTPFKRSTDEAVRAFKGVLLRAGRVATVRVSKGDDEMAACGQLGDPGLGAALGTRRGPVPLIEPPAAFKQLIEGAAAMQAAAAGAAPPPAPAAHL